jgi:Spy/CpxP family protein refolding chaperone
MRNKTTALAVAVAGLISLPAAAQNVKDNLDMTREALEGKRRVLVAGSLPLTEAEEKAFWPVYDDYEKARKAIDERANRLIVDFVTQAAALTDAQAKTMLAQALAVDEDRVKLRREYLGRMGKAIPPRKLVRFFQLDNKLDAMVRADISRQIPFSQ